MLLWPIRERHCNYGITQCELQIYLSLLVLICIEAVELLELGIDLTRHCKRIVLVGRPVSRLHTLDAKFESACLITLLFICRKLLGFFLHSCEISKHTLHLVQLLHATDKLQSCYHMFLQFKVLVLFLQQTSRQVIAIDKKEQIFVIQISEQQSQAIQLVINLLSVAFHTSFVQDSI